MNGPYLRATAKGLAARVEVYFPDKKRLIRVPIVDVGPGKTNPPRVTDLTVAAACFLLDEPDTSKAKGYKRAIRKYETDKAWRIVSTSHGISVLRKRLSRDG